MFFRFWLMASGKNPDQKKENYKMEVLYVLLIRLQKVILHTVLKYLMDRNRCRDRGVIHRRYDHRKTVIILR